MQYDGIEFYNVRELVDQGENGLLISRFPQSVVSALDAQRAAYFSRGCELRFAYTYQTIKVKLYAEDRDGEAVVLFGEHYAQTVRLPKGEVTTVEVSMHEHLLDHPTIDEKGGIARHSSRLCRVFFNNQARVCYCGISYEGKEIDALPQNAQITPKKRFLAYGSSITHGENAVSNYSSYIQCLAQKLGYDVYNFGMSACCMCDHAMADLIASEPDIDFYYLEVGINMRARYTPEVFEERFSYLLEQLKGRKVFLTTIYPNWQTYFEDPLVSEREHSYNDIILRKAHEYNMPVYQGNEILCSATLLSDDLTHPTAHGHLEMAENLYQKLKASV